MERIDIIDQAKVFKTITPGKNEEHVGIHVPQAHLITPILNEATKYKHFHLMVQTKVTDLLLNEEGHYCGVKAIKDGVEWTVKSKIVIGADGRYSTVRKLAEIPVKKINHGYDVIWAKIPAPIGWEPTIKNMLIKGQQVAVFTQAGGFVQIGWNIPKGTFSSLRKIDMEEMIAPIIESLPELRETAKQHLQSWKDTIILDVFSSKSPTWVKNTLAIIGDAAHTMTPTSAIGINAGMKDAYVIAPIINKVLKTNQMHMLKEFEYVRKNEIESLQKGQIHKENEYADQFKQYETV